METETKRIQNEKKWWDRIARKYDSQTGIKDRHMYKDLFELIKQEMVPSFTVLDVDCGTGIISFEIAESVHRVYRIDISEKMIEVAREKLEKSKYTNVVFQTEDGYNTSFEDKSLDLVLCCNVLHALEAPDRFLTEMKRILTPEGTLIASTDCYGMSTGLKFRFKYSLIKFLKIINIIPVIEFYTPEDLKKLVTESGLKTKREQILHYMGTTGFFQSLVK